MSGYETPRNQPTNEQLRGMCACLLMENDALRETTDHPAMQPGRREFSSVQIYEALRELDPVAIWNDESKLVLRVDS